MRSSFSPPNSVTLPLEIPVTTIEMTRRGPIAGAGVVLLVEEVPPDPGIPHVLPGGRVGQIANVELGTDACRRSVVSNGVASVGGSGFTQNSS